LLTSLPANEAIVTTIHSAAFTVSLDESTPTDPVHYSRALWHGDVSSSSPRVATGLMNRWCDKPVQFIVFDNTCAGIMGEHSIMDGTPTARMCDDVLEMIANPQFDHGSPPATSTVSVPQPMDWTVIPALSSAIDSASKEAVALIDSQTLSYHLTPYGKKDIKRFGVSPDGWAQMIIQLAYSRLLAWMGSPRKGATYEAATTRRFYKGRTEAIRVVSNESDAWVRAMNDPNATVETRKAAFATALKRHGADARRSGQGMGVDRHLLG
jgi:carnitine O-acetyltransferase